MLKEQSEPQQFCKPPLPFPPRVLKEHRSVFFQVTAQDVGRHRARQAVFQAEPVSLHHLHRYQHSSGTTRAQLLTRDKQESPIL